MKRQNRVGFAPFAHIALRPLKSDITLISIYLYNFTGDYTGEFTLGNHAQKAQNPPLGLGVRR